MKYNLKRFGYGILIGISNLIPGFSGGTMALILGIYEEFTGAIASVTKTPLKAIKELWSLGLGMVLGILIATFTIAICLNKWPLITSSFFVGLVIATIPLTIKNIKGRKAGIGPWVSLFLCAIISLILPFANKIGIINIDINNPNVLIVIFVMVISSLASATMIIPAASGSLILLAFGLFDPIVTMLKDMLVALKNGDFQTFGSSCIIIVPFSLGVIIGIILIAKIITYLFKHHDLIIWYGILGLLLTSVFTIYYNAYDAHIAQDPSLFTDHVVLNIILSIVFLALGFFGLRFIMKKADKLTESAKEKEQEAA